MTALLNSSESGSDRAKSPQPIGRGLAAKARTPPPQAFEYLDV